MGAGKNLFQGWVGGRGSSFLGVAGGGGTKC